jgi:hypothetical protein
MAHCGSIPSCGFIYLFRDSQQTVSQTKGRLFSPDVAGSFGGEEEWHRHSVLRRGAHRR